MPANRQQEAFFLEQDAFEPAVKQRAFGVMSAIGMLGVHAIELTHPFGQICFWYLHHQMVVIWHQNIALQ
jgi:hypothetical protein